MCGVRARPRHPCTAAICRVERARLLSRRSFGRMAGGSLDGLKQANATMTFGQLMAGGYEQYDMSDMKDAASAIRRASASASGMPDLVGSLDEMIGKDGSLDADPEDAKASAMAVFIMSQRLAIESYTAVRMIASAAGRTS